MDCHHDDEASPRPRWVWLCRAPLIVAVTLICAINAINLGRLVRADAPRNPWEATEVLEAWRSLRGMPVYERPPDGHSTHVYGALVPFIQGEIFRWTGPNNVAGRLLSLVSGLATVTLIALAMRGDRSPWSFVVAWAVLLGVNFRSWEYFAENRPDLTALLFSTMGVLLMGAGQESRRGRLVVLGSACLVVGFFFKQTAFIFAAVPLVAMVLRGRKPTLPEVSFAAFPLLVALGVIHGLKVFNPTVYHYMIAVPKAFGLRWPATARNGWELLLDSPLFLVLLGEWIVVEKGSFRNDPRVAWLAAVLAVALPFSAITSAKVGGATNSLLPALFPLMAFCALRLPRLMRYLERPTSPLPSRLMLGAFLALLVLLTAFPRLSNQHSLFVPESPHQGAYWDVVGLVKRLPGMVICPEDPTIAFYGKRHLGLNIFSEYDTHLVGGTFPVTPPPPVLDELDAADYLVDVYDDHQNILDDRMLRDLGYEPVLVEDAALVPADYRLWRRVRRRGHQTLANRRGPSKRLSRSIPDEVRPMTGSGGIPGVSAHFMGVNRPVPAQGQGNQESRAKQGPGS